MTIRVAQLFPDLTNGQGDAENAVVLDKMLGWLGLSHEMLVVSSDLHTIPPADILVLGHVVDSQRDALEAHMGEKDVWLRQQLDNGATLLAVGSSIELLCSRRICLGTVQQLPHTFGDVVGVYDGANRDVWGFENSTRGYERGPSELPLLKLTRGRGNGDGTDGLISPVGNGTVVWTNLHGPVLARNPELALSLIQRTLVHRRAARAVAASSANLNIGSPDIQRAIRLADSLWTLRSEQLESER